MSDNWQEDINLKDFENAKKAAASSSGLDNCQRNDDIVHTHHTEEEKTKNLNTSQVAESEFNYSI